MQETATEALRELEALRYDFSPEAAARKLDLLQTLDQRRLPSAEQVRELHQLLGFVRAFGEQCHESGRVASGAQRLFEAAAHRDVRAVALAQRGEDLDCGVVLGETLE